MFVEVTAIDSYDAQVKITYPKVYPKHNYHIQTIHIDELIVVMNNVGMQLVDIRGKKIRLGFTAPKNVSIDREEIWNSKTNE